MRALAARARRQTAYRRQYWQQYPHTPLRGPAELTAVSNPDILQAVSAVHNLEYQTLRVLAA